MKKGNFLLLIFVVFLSIINIYSVYYDLSLDINHRCLFKPYLNGHIQLWVTAKPKAPHVSMFIGTQQKATL